MDVFDSHRDKAARLYARAEELASACDVAEFLPMLARFSDYSTVNLLLILEQFPRATFLASAAYWQEQMKGVDHILRPEWEGKGIDIIIPALVSGDSNTLVPFAVKVYDARQTCQDGLFPVSGMTEQEQKDTQAALCSYLMREDNEDAYNLSQDKIPESISTSSLYILPDDPSAALFFAILSSVYNCFSSEDEDNKSSYKEDYNGDEPDESLPTPDVQQKEVQKEVLPYLMGATWLMAYGLPIPTLTDHGQELLQEITSLEALDSIRERYIAFEEQVSSLLPVKS